MKNPKFKIGDWVLIKAKVRLDYDKNGYRQVKRTPTEKTGQICGAKRRFLGKISNPSYYSGDQAYLTVKGSILVWLVRIGYLNKPIEVFEEDIELIFPMILRDMDKLLFIEPGTPWFYRDDPFWTERDKEDLRKYMKDHPRDEKGRWK